MITKQQQKEGVELMRTLVEKAWESTTFKDQLVRNPVETIQSITGKKFQEAIKFVVEDQTDNNFIYLIIPQKPNLDELELSDEQLNMVAGGEFVAAGVAIALVGLFATGVGTGLAISAMKD